MEPGTIVLWFGAIVNIPTGWVLCDGANGTPDLQDKFVVGAGDTYNPGDGGGSVTHTHPFTSDGHVHSIDSGNSIGAGTDYADVTASEVDGGTSDAGDTLPPYHALAYIMKT